MVATKTRQTIKRARTGKIRRGPTRVLRGGRTREAWRDRIPGVHFATAEEGRRMFDFQARKLFGISGEEFLKRLDAGEYDHLTDLDEIHKVNRQVMLLPGVRRTPA